VLFFFSGFQSRASWYAHIVDHISSWGVLVVQYDILNPIFSMPTVRQELEAFPLVVQWVAHQSTSDPTSRLYGQADAARMAAAGHSRGGKLAALLFASEPSSSQLVPVGLLLLYTAAHGILKDRPPARRRPHHPSAFLFPAVDGTTFKAAYLLDPVDATSFAPESPDFPSAAKALAASGKQVGVTGAGLTGSCNPAEGNYQVVYAAAATGSWKAILPNVSHSQFGDAGAALNLVQDALCGRGERSRAQVAGLSAPFVLAWLWQQLEAAAAAAAEAAAAAGADSATHNAPSPSPLPAFYSWVKRQEAAGLLTFEVKGAAAPEPPEAPPLRPAAVFPLFG
jgi:hypothetical protein